MSTPITTDQVTSKDPCPICLLQNNVINPLQDRAGQFASKCRAGHEFNDTEELNLLRAQARQRYPTLYQGPAAPPPADPVELASRNIVIDSETKKAIEELSGTVVTSAPDIKGLVFAYVNDNKDKEAEIRRLRAMAATARQRVSTGNGGSAMLSSNQVVVTLPEWAMEGGIAEQAAHAGMSVGDWINNEISAYFENYFSQASGR